MREIFSLRLTLLAKYNCSSFFLCKKHVHQNRLRSACRKRRPLDLVRGFQEGLWREGEAAALSLSAVGGRYKSCKNNNKSGGLLSTWLGPDVPLSALSVCLNNCTVVIIPVFQMRTLSPERGRHIPKVTQQNQYLNPDPTRRPLGCPKRAPSQMRKGRKGKRG